MSYFDSDAYWRRQDAVAETIRALTRKIEALEERVAQLEAERMNAR